MATSTTTSGAAGVRRPPLAVPRPAPKPGRSGPREAQSAGTMPASTPAVSRLTPQIRVRGVKWAAAHGCHGYAQQGNVVMIFESLGAVQ